LHLKASPSHPAKRFRCCQSSQLTLLAGFLQFPVALGVNLSLPPR
jgi:hypothetical protein